jgi:hypothetical protein
VRYINAAYSPFDWEFPALDFKLLNRTGATFLLAEAVFEVEESRTDTTPIIAIKADIQQAFAGFFWLHNESATDLENLIIRYQILPGDVPFPERVSTSYAHEFRLEKLEDSVQVVVEQAFEQAGVNIRELDALSKATQDQTGKIVVRYANGSESTISADEWDKAIVQCLGPFQDGIGTVIGEVDFTLPGGLGPKYTIRFRTPVHVFNRKRSGLPRPPTYIYNVELDLDKFGYKKIVPISQQLSPGEADRFLIKVATSRSSVHRFRVIFRDVSGHELRSPLVMLRCLVPRTKLDTALEQPVSGENKAEWSRTLG